MRKAIVVTLDILGLSGRKREQVSEEDLRELNEHLAQGWQVVHSIPMSGSGNASRSVSIVILEKD